MGVALHSSQVIGRARCAPLHNLRTPATTQQPNVTQVGAQCTQHVSLDGAHISTNSQSGSTSPTRHQVCTVSIDRDVCMRN
jgi:hypothetical protein